MKEIKNKFRVYALILGEVIITGNFMGCSIIEMEYEEQQGRKFSPIQGTFSEDLVKDYETYATHLPYIDPLKIKSKYLIVYDSPEAKPLEALGDAIRHFDRACRYLSIGVTQDIKTSIREEVASFHPYLYQAVKIYKIEDGKEADFDLDFHNRSIHFPRRPEKTEWRDSNTQEYLEGLIDFQDEVLERALKYLYRSSIGLLILDSPEKRALDHFKSIEIIINSLSNKREFKDRLSEAKILLNLSGDQESRILELWDERSTFGDIAHPSKYDQVERYPHQFPLPSNVQYTGLMDSTAGKLILRYYEFKRKEYKVTIENGVTEKMEDNWGVVNPGTESNHFVIFTNETDKTKLQKKIKDALAEELSIDIDQIVDYQLLPRRIAAVLRIN